MRASRLRTSVALMAALPLMASCDRSSTHPRPQPSAQVHAGRVSIENKKPRGDASEADRRALVQAIRGLHEAWLATDQKAYGDHLTKGVTRALPQIGRFVSGRENVLGFLPREWSEFERRDGGLSMTMKISDLELYVVGDVATALYRMEASGKKGTRWPFDDAWLVLQMFERTDGGYKLLYETKSVGLDEEDGDAADAGFEFDFAVPVTDLSRAVSFYTGILGAPEFVTSTHASFHAGGPRFRLDSSSLDGRAKVRKGLPNGYGIFLVREPNALVDKLRKGGATIHSTSADRSIVGDVAGNVFVIERAGGRELPTGAPGRVVVTGPTSASKACENRVVAGVTAWLRRDPKGAGEVRFDDRRRRVGGVARGTDAVGKALALDWAEYDRSPGGILASARIRSLEATQAGASTLLSYSLELKGTTGRDFREEALVTELWNGGCEKGTLNVSFVSKMTGLPRHARALDYTGYPVPKLSQAGDFYGRVMGLGKPYRDEGWLGYWSSHAVFGLFSASREEDEIPVPGMANGYVSFWVGSAKELEVYLRAAQVDFPIVPAINSKASVEKLGGYTQIVANDSEGNLTVYTEYTGR